MRTMRVGTVLLTSAVLASAQERPAGPDGSLQPAAFEDYLLPVGRMENGVLR